MPLDAASLRAQFPSLDSGIAHFDGPGGTQTPRQVGDAVARTLTGPLSTRGSSVLSERNAEEAVGAFRSAMADFLNADPRGIVYGRSATQLTYDFSRHLAKAWRPGGNVVVTRLDHDSNVRPWIQAAEANGQEVRWISIDPATAELDWASAEAAIDDRTAVVAFAGASNILGTIPDIGRMVALAHAHGAYAYLDAVHYAAHELVDLPALGVDFVVCSPYKFLGPHCGVLAATPDLLETITPDKLLPSTNLVPERFEFGTLPYELMAGVTAAVDFLAAIDSGQGTTRREQLSNTFAALHEHEARLRTRIEEGLASFGDGVVLHSRAQRRTPTLLITMPGRRTADASAFLAARDVLAPSGSFYGYEPFHALGVDDVGALRVGLAPYNDDRDVDRLLEGLAEFLGS
jgi:cysteine desulfurase family protein (TIGR01976 family)